MASELKSQSKWYPNFWDECLMTTKLRIDSYEAGIGSVGGLAAVHNNLYPRLVQRGFDVKTF